MSWTVFKFGGASIKDANAVKNLIKIVKNQQNKKLLVVVSAIGKTTNALEHVWEYWINEQFAQALEQVEFIEAYHQVIVDDLFDGPKETFEMNEVSAIFTKLKTLVAKKAPDISKEAAYDLVIPFGELLSTTIIHRYASSVDMHGTWLDARKLIKTNDNYQEAEVDWVKTRGLIQGALANLGAGFENLVFTQGFIGGGEKQQTTLGREGSDFSAAIFAHCIQARKMVIWKDVQGVLNADPKYFENTQLLSRISFKEAIELSYYGATVIHPKTIKPLQNLAIPLWVKSFIAPNEEGTLIQEQTSDDDKIPSFIFKVKQQLISIQPRDFSFIVEKNLVDIFALFSKARVKIHLMENSALSFTVCVDENERLDDLIDALKHRYIVRYNQGLELITVRHYTQNTIDHLLKNKQVLLEQKSRETARFVVKNKA